MFGRFRYGHKPKRGDEIGVRQYRVVRGGAYINNGANCRSAQRNRNDDINQNVGFRVVVSASTFQDQSLWKGFHE